MHGADLLTLTHDTLPELATLKQHEVRDAHMALKPHKKHFDKVIKKMRKKKHRHRHKKHKKHHSKESGWFDGLLNIADKGLAYAPALGGLVAGPEGFAAGQQVSNIGASLTGILRDIGF